MAWYDRIFSHTLPVSLMAWLGSHQGMLGEAALGEREEERHLSSLHKHLPTSPQFLLSHLQYSHTYPSFPPSLAYYQNTTKPSSFLPPPFSNPSKPSSHLPSPSLPHLYQHTTTPSPLPPSLPPSVPSRLPPSLPIHFRVFFDVRFQLLLLLHQMSRHLCIHIRK